MSENQNATILELLGELDKCLENNLYFAALNIALTLPDICGKAEYPAEGVTARYIKWYNEYIGKYERPDSPYSDEMPYISGEVLYNLRNSIFHQGNPNITKDAIKDQNCKIDHFSLVFSQSLFTGDTSQVSYSSLNPPHIKERAYTLNVRVLCLKLRRVVEGYWNENKEKFNFFNFVIDREIEE